MTEEKFLEKMADLLDTEVSLCMETKLEDIEEWDSLSRIAFLAMSATQSGRKILPGELKTAETVADLYKLLNEDA